MASLCPMAEAFFGLVEVVETDEVILVENEVVPFLVVVAVVAVVVVAVAVVAGVPPVAPVTAVVAVGGGGVGAVSSVESSVVNISGVVDSTVLKNQI
jgi:hypothetical protein